MKNYSLLLFLLFALLFSSCGGDDNDGDLCDFDLVGTWSLISVSADAIYNGSPGSDIDQTPAGSFTFNNDLTGRVEIEFELFGFLHQEIEDVTYSACYNMQFLDITESDGTVENWKLISTSDNQITAEWELEINSTLSGTITMIMAR